MSVLTITEVSRSCNKDLDQFHRVYDRVFCVKCTDGTESFDNILVAIGITIGTDTLPEDTGALAVSVSVKNRGGNERQFFDVTYKYDSNPPIEELREPDPTEREPIFRYSNQKIQKPMTVDLEDLPIINSAGLAFEQPIEIPTSQRLIQIEKNYADISDVPFDLQDSVNNAEVTLDSLTYDAYSLYLDSIDVSMEQENGIAYRKATYRIVHNKTLYHPYKILDAGFATRGIDGELHQITDATGAPISKPHMLDGDGGESDTPISLDFHVYELKDWSSIPG